MARTARPAKCRCLTGTSPSTARSSTPPSPRPSAMCCSTQVSRVKCWELWEDVMRVPTMPYLVPRNSRLVHITSQHTTTASLADGIAQLVKASLTLMDESVAKEIASDIVLVGRTTLVPGFKEQLLFELFGFLPNELNAHLKMPRLEAEVASSAADAEVLFLPWLQCSSSVPIASPRRSAVVNTAPAWLPPLLFNELGWVATDSTPEDVVTQKFFVDGL